MPQYNKKFIFLLAILIGGELFFGIGKVLAEDQGVNIKMTIQNPPSSPTPLPPPPADKAPTISGVTTTVGNNSAAIVWSASDDKGITSVSFVYGLTDLYGQTGNISGAYGVSLSGLTSSTVYYYKIAVTDTASQVTNYTGNFQTLSNQPLDVTPPVISNIVVTPAQTSAVITFSTNENSTGQVDYGLTAGLGSNSLGGNSADISHEISLLGLTANTTYFYRIIATDVALNSANSTVLNFKTLKDTSAPPDVSNFKIATGTGYLALNWTNPSVAFTPDFAGVKVLRKIGTHASSPSDSTATEVYKGNNQSYSDSSVLANNTYYYTIFSYDKSLNYSPGVFVSSELNQVITEICNNNIDDDNNGKVDCADAACVNDQNCVVKIPSSTEPIIAKPACSDGLDNDNDGLVDFPADSGCTSASDSDEYSPPGTTVPSFNKLNLNKVRFFGGSHQIELFPQGNNVAGLANSNISLEIKKSALIGTPKSFILRIGDSEQHQFVSNASGDAYFADSIFPSSGSRQAFVEIDYGAGQFDSLGIDLQAVNFGQVQDENNQKISGAQVTLYQENNQIFPASVFGQINPLVTNNTEQIGWMVPSGRYYLVASKDGFYDYKSSSFDVGNNIVNQSITLVTIPKKLLDAIDPNATLGQNVVNVVNNLADKTKAATIRAKQKIGDAAKVAQQVAADPAVKEAARTVVAPSAVGVAAVSTATVVSWADILPLLRFLFLQPVLLLGRGKREKWGSVYNSLSKLPIDLAIIRLINAETNKILQTKVTSSDGRYFFVVNAGKYRLEVKKGNFLFPSDLLKDFQVDGQKSDIYHGEEIIVSEQGIVITANIPMDPSGQAIKTPRSLLLAKSLRRIQHAVSWLGLVVTTVTLYISPTWYMWLLLGAHLAMTIIFRRLSKAPPAKGWGIVYDDGNKKPLSNVVARLFDSRFNKLVATEVTSADGKYYFVAGENQYYISYDRNGYEPKKTEIIDLKGKEIETVAEDIGLDKKSI